MRAVLTTMIALAGCAAKPTAFSRGDRIPLEAYTATVSYSEEFATGPRRTLAVHFVTTGINARGDVGNFFVMFSGHMKLIDGAGNEYGALPFTQSYYYSHQATPFDNPRSFPLFADTSNLKDWVAVARVPMNARGFSLYIGNPAARPGQPRAAIVRLDR